MNFADKASYEERKASDHLSQDVGTVIEFLWKIIVCEFDGYDIILFMKWTLTMLIVKFLLRCQRDVSGSICSSCESVLQNAVVLGGSRT